MEGTGRKDVRREVRGRKKMPHLAALMGLVGPDVRAYVDGKPCRFTGGLRLDVGTGERAVADAETRRSAAVMRVTLDTFTAAIPEGELHAAKLLLLREMFEMHREHGADPPRATIEVARELGLDWSG